MGSFPTSLVSHNDFSTVKVLNMVVCKKTEAEGESVYIQI